jgi:hypothetical protein
MGQNHWVAAEGKQRMPGGGIAGAKGSVSPAGVLHAVDPGTERVACGQPLRELVPFRDLLWARLRTGSRCRSCAEIVAEHG